MISLFLIVNKLGQPRLRRSYTSIDFNEEREIILQCLYSHNNECTILEYKNDLIVFDQIENLHYIALITRDENELAMLELFNNFNAILKQYFKQDMKEIDILNNLDKVYFILDEMICNGRIVNCTPRTVLYSMTFNEKKI